MKCPVCQSTRLSAKVSYMSFENHARFPGLGKGLFGGSGDLAVGAEHARVCLDCGYLMLFVSRQHKNAIDAA